MTVLLTSKNLISNPGGETGPFSTSFSTDVAPQGWAVTGTFSSVGYAVGGSSDLNPADGIAAQGGNAYFSGGTSAGVSTATQHVSLKAYAAQINQGSVNAVVSGQFGGFSSQEDFMSLTVRFLARDGVTVLGEQTLTGPTAAERGAESTLLFEEISFGAVPSGTRFMDVILTATRLNGTYNDAYADNISVHLTGITTGNVLVSGDHVFATDTVQLATGIVFDNLADATGSFLSSQFGTTGIALNALVEGSSHVDTLSITLDSASFAASDFRFANWTPGLDQVRFTDDADGTSVTGTRQDDQFSMAGGADKVNGSAGDDLIDGGSGRDVLRGGLGADDFVLSISAASRDRLADFTTGQDHLEVSVAEFGLILAPGSALGSAFLSNATGLAEASEDRFVYNTVTGVLFFDADGSDAGFAAHAVASLTGAPVLNDTDFLLIA